MDRLDKDSQDLEAMELSDGQLAFVSGGGKHGGPICPICGSNNVQFDAHQCKVLKCYDCGYVAP